MRKQLENENTRTSSDGREMRSVVYLGFKKCLQCDLHEGHMCRANSDEGSMCMACERKDKTSIVWKFS